jgi:hypothetical protein
MRSWAGGPLLTGKQGASLSDHWSKQLGVRPFSRLSRRGPCRYASSSQPTSNAAPNFFQVLTDPALRLVSIAAISARHLRLFA